MYAFWVDEHETILEKHEHYHGIMLTKQTFALSIFKGKVN